MGFTHLERLPVNEYPFDGSWGYQPPGSMRDPLRHRDDFRYFINAAHAAGLNAHLDWVPGHFPADDFASPRSTALRCMSTAIRARASRDRNT